LQPATALLSLNLMMLEAPHIVMLGTTHRYAGSWIASDSLGMYKNFIPDGGFGNSKRAIPIRGDRLHSPTMSITVHDMDGVLNAILSGQYSRQIRGADARLRIMAQNIAAEAYHLRFSGQILHVSKPKRATYVFDLGPKAPELETLLRVPIVTKAIWPDADAAAIGKPAPLVYGVHSSASLGSRGMLPTLYVDDVNFRYLVSHQYIESIDAVYVDHVVQGSGFATSYREVEGHRYTLLDFTGDQGTSTITVDATGGVPTGARGTFDEITNPATQLKAIVANYIFNEWDGQPDNWHDETDSPIYNELFQVTEQMFNNRGVKGAISISEQMTGLAFINLWSSEYCPAFWTSDAKLAIRPNDWYFTYDSWNETRFRAKEGEHFIGDLAYDYSTELLADEWNVGFLYSAADNDNLERIRVTDTLRGWNISESLDLKLSESTV
jgi:hypothetical protein